MGGAMIACKPDDVKVVATVLANTVPEAFAGYETCPSDMQFDIDADFSERERHSFIALAARIVDALYGANASVTPAEPENALV
ncbi:hypothetical protein GCM10007036_38590 [Alsobacter metallidurans]|uniref:Uncharacterized protein n=2 Tax=Alsobacter metallidurans TaxID=340221 RepID=A0A917MJU4_9HYPH|nr:hypothetical protein GCM10007036_38590 [Alsobacter metallidurans]